MNKYVLISALVLIIIGGVWVSSSGRVPTPGNQACPQEAKLCPDGSAVGRTGPNCEFAACPAVVATSSATIGGNVTVNGTSIGILGLAEDSRCPVDVQCIQAGTVRVRASVDALNRDFTFTLGQPQEVGNVIITLASVIPSQKYSKQTLQPGDYQFTFTVVAKVTTGNQPLTTGVRGTVLLGPICPVERIPPDPRCADKPYATVIDVRHSGASSVFATGRSDATGAFEFSLPTGSYTLTAGGGTMLPRCNPTKINVGTTGYATTTISCDSGIR